MKNLMIVCFAFNCVFLLIRQILYKPCTLFCFSSLQDIPYNTIEGFFVSLFLDRRQLHLCRKMFMRWGWQDLCLTATFHVIFHLIPDFYETFTMAPLSGQVLLAVKTHLSLTAHSNFISFFIKIIIIQVLQLCFTVLAKIADSFCPLTFCDTFSRNLVWEELSFLANSFSTAWAVPAPICHIPWWKWDCLGKMLL